ncbi:MAG TPA: hypothetical protein VLJ57_05010 [Burkholderiaceae bacterium]|nr:hypothetical protein [Burkholderiaceae bacterium]
MRHFTSSRAAAASLLAWLCTSTCQAGRPITVDDANVNEPGASHVEAWGARDPGGIRTWTIAPAHGVHEALELGASLTRDTGNRLLTTAIQAKLLFSASRPDGCNTGAVFGLAHTRASGADSGGNTPYLNGLLSCNRDALAFHANLGANRPTGGPVLPTWGLALERALGAVTLHAESFGQRHAKPVFQVGARTELAKDVQLDATLGRHNRKAVYSAGLKFGF